MTKLKPLACIVIAGSLIGAQAAKATDGTISEIDQLLAAKEKEILTV